MKQGSEIPLLARASRGHDQEGDSGDFQFSFLFIGNGLDAFSLQPDRKFDGIYRSFCNLLDFDTALITRGDAQRSLPLIEPLAQGPLD